MICYTTRLKITRISRTVSELKRESPECLPEKTGYCSGILRNPPLLRYCLKQGDFSLLHISDMVELQKKSGRSCQGIRQER